MLELTNDARHVTELPSGRPVTPFAPPRYAMACEPWETHAGTVRRLFTVREWRVGHVRVSVGGEQTSDGAVSHWLFVTGDDEFTSSSDRERLIEALHDAGKLLDALL
jgi:hypothetical protein